MTDYQKHWTRWTLPIVYAAQLAIKTGELQYVDTGKGGVIIKPLESYSEKVQPLSAEQLLVKFIQGTGEQNCFRSGYHQALNDIQGALQIVTCAGELQAVIDRLKDSNLSRALDIYLPLIPPEPTN